MKINKNKGQNLLEYTLILAIITVVLLGMRTYFKRGIQSVIKVAADDYGTQGDVIGEVEIAIKKQKYKPYNPGGEDLIKSESTGSWTQNIENLGEGNIHTELSGTNTVTGNSFWIGGDYRTRRLQDIKSAAPSTPGE